MKSHFSKDLERFFYIRSKFLVVKEFEMHVQFAEAFSDQVENLRWSFCENS